ncbi:4723_t:CDS:2, partial [Cetraspora pellucida]
ETYETRIESFQQDLLKWLQKINKTIRQGNEDLFQKENDNEMVFHEKQESLKCLEKRINELQSMIEQKFSKSTLEGLFNHEFSQLKELFQDSTDVDEMTTDTSDLDLTHDDSTLAIPNKIYKCSEALCSDFTEFTKVSDYPDSDLKELT